LATGPIWGSRDMPSAVGGDSDHLSCGDEPTLFEAESCPRAPRGCPVVRYSDLDARTDDAEEAAYFGDVDVDGAEQPVDPVDAFEVFAGRTFPTGAKLDFSGDVYRESLMARNLLSAAARRRFGAGAADGRLPLESYTGRMERLRLELDDLGRQQGPSTADTSIQLGELRQTLDRIMSQGGKLSDASALPLVEKRSVRPEAPVPDTFGAIQAAPARCVATDEVAGCCDLDRRVARLESSLAGGVDPGPGGLWGLIDSVRVQLDAADPSYLRSVRTNVETLTAALDNTPALSDFADASQLVDRLDAIEPSAASIPTLTARLRTLKCSLDDAGSVVGSLAALGSRYDRLASSRRENKALLERVEQNLETNLETVVRNMQGLEKRLRDALPAGNEGRRPS
jgi:hypothetical protein